MAADEVSGGTGETRETGTTGWTRGGVRFACQRCGNCCTGRGSVVRVGEREVEALARQLGMGVQAFLERHTRERWGNIVLVDDPETGDCEWLERREGGTTACRVQEAKPDQCRSYPFWPRLLASREAWEAEGRRCRGIGQGEPVPAEEVDRRTGRADAEDALDLLLEELAYEVRDLGAVCWLSGACCDFPAAGHRLYLSRIEAERLARAVDLAAWDPASGLCPAWKDGRCTARAHRPLTCRTYFCDPTRQEAVHELTERYLTRLKWLHERHGLPWDYRELVAHLVDLRGGTVPGTNPPLGGR